MTAVEHPMSFDWLDWRNPIAIWWCFLVLVSLANIVLWRVLHRRFRRRTSERADSTFRVDLMVLLCAAYVFGCAFRSVLPRADIQRICLFDTWLCSVLVGRSVATIAEVCFAIQWAIVLRQLAGVAKSDTARNISGVIVPLILLAECCSWYAVITTSFLGNAIENSIWALAFLLIAVALLRLMIAFHGLARLAIGVTVAGVACYLAFLVVIDVPMYFARWQADLASGREPLGMAAGLYDVSTRWIVTHDFGQWKDEMAWMGLYFSVAVWSSLGLCGFGLVEHHLPSYRAGAQHPRRSAWPLSVGARSGGSF
jgi:hypothetical protein